MDNIGLIFTAVLHSVYARITPTRGPVREDEDRDRGSLSLEHVLWFVAAAVAVVVIAGIVYTKIKGEANKPVQAPTAP